MDTLKQFNEALYFVEEQLKEGNMEEDLVMEKVFRIAGCSEYHFKRMFSFLAGLPFGEYIRKRKLSMAGERVAGSDRKIIDISLDFGYASPDAFTRAFSAFHGITPKDARKSGSALKMYPPLTFRLTVQGGNEMEYRIVEKEAFKIVGIMKRISLQYEGVNPEMDSMWQSLTMEDFQELKGLCNTDPSGIICVSCNFEERIAEGTKLDQYIGVAVSGELPAGKWTVLDVEPYTWAVFTAVGQFPDALQNVWARIYGEWIPSSGYELVQGPEILWNESPDTSKPDYKSEIWVPVVKKEG